MNGSSVSRRVMVPSRSKIARLRSSMPHQPASGRLSAHGKLAQDIVQDAAVLEIFALLGGVDANLQLETQRRAGIGCRDDRDRFSPALRQALRGESFPARQAQRPRV